MKLNNILLIDFDSTFVTVESLDELAKIVLKGRPDKKKVLAQIVAITNLGMEGKITFPESLARRLKLFKPKKQHLEKLILLLHEVITPTIKRNKKFFKENAERIYILSGGFTEYMIPVLDKFGITEDHILGNTLLFDKDGNVIGYDQQNPLAQEKGKVKMIKAMKFDLPIVMVGDGYTDYEIKEAGLAEKFIAFTENVKRETIIGKADVIATNFDEVIETVKKLDKPRMKALLLEGLDQDTVDVLDKENIDIEYIQRALTEKELIEKIEDIDILGIRTRTNVTEAVIAKAKKLRIIGAFCTGTEHVDIAAAKKKNIQVFHSPFGSTRSVVELVIGCMIMLARQVPDKNRLMHEGIWDKSYKDCHEIKGKTLGIIGYGHIGTMLSIVAEALGMQVCFYDAVDRMPYGNTKACQTLKELLAVSDVITLHVDGREENNNLIGEKEFGQMKDGVLFINASRGQVVDYDALVSCIKNGKVAGAALDVFINNPLARGDPFVSPLQHLPNVILTPHLGGSTEEALRARGLYVAKKIIKFLDKENVA